MTVYQWLCLIGVPALIAGVFKYLHGLIKRNMEDSKALKAGIQALLRSQMISDFNKYTEKGFAPIYARESAATGNVSIFPERLTDLLKGAKE